MSKTKNQIIQEITDATIARLTPADTPEKISDEVTQDIEGYIVLENVSRGKGYGLKIPETLPHSVTADLMAAMFPIRCVACAGLVYLLLSLLIKLFGTGKVMRFFPPIVTGPIIIAIGLTLSQSAIDNCSSDWLIAIVAIALVIVCNIWGKGMVKIIPILLGVLGSYALALVMGKVDFAPIAQAELFGSPIHASAMAKFDVGAILTIMPIALAAMMEHIGDMAAISATVGQNFIARPGLARTLLGDGLATTLAGFFGGPANTTYGENTGVLALTRVFDPRVVRIAACFAILFSFCPKFAAVISCMPACVIGGVSLVLYGMISAVGIRNLVENHVDFMMSRNVLITALILVLSLGIASSAAGAIVFEVGGVTVALSGLAVGSVVGILLNIILPGKEEGWDGGLAAEAEADDVPLPLEAEVTSLPIAD